MATALVQSPEATWVEFDGASPSDREADVETFLVRAANFVVAYSRVEPGSVLNRAHQPDEYMVLLLDTGAEVATAAESIDVGANALIIVPPGRSRVVSSGRGQIVRVFTARNHDLASRSLNARRYTRRPPGLAELGPPVAPASDGRPLPYRLADYPVDEGGFRVFRSRELMLNIFGERTAPRDRSAVTPHWHPDFEQASLALAGTWEHHLRYPWVPDMTTWRADEHIRCGSPSLTVIPAGVEHTSLNVERGRSLLVDVFAPPRQDFLERGLVLNKVEYEER